MRKQPNNSMEIRMTFETLYEILRKEKFRQELQKLDEKFFENLVNYLQEKQAILDSQQKKSIFSQEKERTQQELSNIRKMIKELYEKREQKIIQLAMLSTRTNNAANTASMLKQEQILFSKIKERLTSQRNEVLNSLLEAKIPKIKPSGNLNAGHLLYDRKIKPKDIKTEKQDTTKLIRFIHSIPKFVAEDMQIYGPYIDEDVANLPAQTANLLITKNKAEAIET